MLRCLQGLADRPHPPRLGTQVDTGAECLGAHVPSLLGDVGHVCSSRVQAQPGHCFTLHVGLRSGPAQWRVHRPLPRGWLQ